MNEILKKVYTVEKDGITLYFVFAKNAKKESKVYKSEEISEDDFLNGIDSETFIDVTEWKEKNKEKNKEKVKAVKNEYSGNQTNELSEFKGLYDELKKEVEELKKQNESLKKGKLKLSFEDAEKLYRKKAELLRQLSKYERKKEILNNLDIEDDEKDVLNFGNIKFRLEYKAKSDYSFNDTLVTSSKMIVNEFIPFIINKLDNKIVDIQKDVETIDI